MMEGWKNIFQMGSSSFDYISSNNEMIQTSFIEGLIASIFTEGYKMSFNRRMCWTFLWMCGVAHKFCTEIHDQRSVR